INSPAYSGRPSITSRRSCLIADRHEPQPSSSPCLNGQFKQVPALRRYVSLSTRGNCPSRTRRFFNSLNHWKIRPFSETIFSCASVTPLLSKQRFGFCSQANFWTSANGSPIGIPFLFL